MNYSRLIEKGFGICVGIGICKLAYDHFSLKKLCKNSFTENNQIKTQYIQFLDQMKNDKSYYDSFKFEKQRANYKKTLIDFLNKIERKEKLEKQIEDYNFIIKWLNQDKIKKIMNNGNKDELKYKEDIKRLINKLDQKKDNYHFKIDSFKLNKYNDLKSNQTEIFDAFWGGIEIIKPLNSFGIKPNYVFQNGAELLNQNSNYLKPIDGFLFNVDDSFNKNQEELMWYHFIDGLPTIKIIRNN